MQTPHYQSVSHILAEVRAMRVRGGSAFGVAAAAAFRIAARETDLDNPNALLARLDEVAEALLAEKPTMATIHNARQLIVEETRPALAGVDLSAARQMVIARADHFIRHSERAVDDLGRIGSKLVQNGQIIMMHSFSESVLAIFATARRLGSDFTVICTESRPLREGRFAAERLANLDIPVRFVTDASMAAMVPQADWMLVGADSIGMDGAVANKMGTQLLALVADRFAKPFYVAAEMLKIRPETQQGTPIVLEQRPAREVLADGELTESGRVQVINQFFDLTPPGHIRAIITEQGVYAPTQIPLAWQALQSAFAKQAAAT